MVSVHSHHSLESPPAGTLYANLYANGLYIVRELQDEESVRCLTNESHRNPGIYYLQRHYTSIDRPVSLGNAIPLHAKTELLVETPTSNEGYARISDNYNPIHVSPIFSRPTLPLPELRLRE